MALSPTSATFSVLYALLVVNDRMHGLPAGRAISIGGLISHEQFVVTLIVPLWLAYSVIQIIQEGSLYSRLRDGNDVSWYARVAWRNAISDLAVVLVPLTVGCISVGISGRAGAEPVAAWLEIIPRVCLVVLMLMSMRLVLGAVYLFVQGNAKLISLSALVILFVGVCAYGMAYVGPLNGLSWLTWVVPGKAVLYSGCSWLGLIVFSLVCACTVFVV